MYKPSTASRGSGNRVRSAMIAARMAPAASLSDSQGSKYPRFGLYGVVKKGGTYSLVKPLSVLLRVLMGFKVDAQ